jgi:hypothetical protein
MDNFSAQGSNHPSDKPLVFSEKDPAIVRSKIKKIIIKFVIPVMGVIFLLCLLITGYNLYDNNSKKVKQARIDIVGQNGGVRDYMVGLKGFMGEIINIKDKEIQAKWNNEVMLIEINDKTIVREIIQKEPKEADLSRISKGDVIRAAGPYIENRIVAEYVIFYTIN